MAVRGEVRAERGLEFLGDFGVVDRQGKRAGDLEGGVLDGVAGEGLGGNDAADAREGFLAGCRIGRADVDGEAGVVDDNVFGVAGLDAGAGYDGGVVAWDERSADRSVPRAIPRCDGTRGKAGLTDRLRG